MTNDNQEVFMQFAHEVSGCAGDLNSLRDALAGVAYCYHISAVEAEIMTPSGNDGSQNTEEFTIFIRENVSPVGEPAKYIFDQDYNGKAVLYVYADDHPFTDSEKTDLEMFALVCSFVLEKRKIYGC